MEYLLVIIFLSKIFYGYPNPHILTLKHLNDGFGHQDPEFINIGGVWLWLWGLIAVQSDQNQSKITQNKPFLLQYRPDMVMIWPPMASIPLYQSHTTSTSHIQCHMGSMLAEMGSKLAKISQKSIKISHFYTFCALSFQYQATHRPNIWPQLDFTKSPRGFRCYLNHWLTFGSDITAPSTIPIFHWNQAKSENTDFFLSQPKSPETPKMVLISISNDKNANWTKFEWNPLENSRFQFCSAGTPDSQRTFFVLAVTPLRVI